MGDKQIASADEHWRLMHYDIELLSHLREGFHMSVESVLLEQFFEGEVHTVVPEMLWVRRQVDTLSVLVSQTNITINSKPVLQWENHPHCWAIHVLINDEFGDFWCHLLWSFTPPAHLLVVELLSDLAVFLPPSTNRVHVVGTDSTNAMIRSVRWVSESYGWVLRHALNLEREDLQLVHDIRHTGRHHTEVLAAAEHVGRSDECRQLLECRLAPERSVAVVEVVVVDVSQELALVGIKLLVVV